MPTVATELPHQVKRGLDLLNLAEAAEVMFGAADTLVECEQSFRQRGRLRAIQAGDARMAAVERREERLNEAGRRQARRGASQFEQAKQLSREVQQEIDTAIGINEFADRLTDFRETLAEEMVEGDITGTELEEVLQAWDEIVAILDRGGYQGLLDAGKKRAEEVVELRGQRNRGREGASPLSKWKYAIIAAFLAIGIASIIACFVWGGCSWVVALAQFLGGPAAGVIIVMINKGCPPTPLAV
jgi:hypothetical protein